MDDVTLPPELERFAAAERDAFIASLEAAQGEGEREGFAALDEVMGELDAIIAEADAARH